MAKGLHVFLLSLLVGMLFLPSVASADVLEVQVGYADNLRSSPFFPTPWCGSVGTTFDGSSPNGGCGMTFDSGAIRLINNGLNPIVVTDVSVNVGGAITDIWNAGGAFTIAPGTSAILAQTGQFNFDSSDQPFQNLGPNDGIIPTVTITTLGGGTNTLNDTGQVLNTSGIDFACSDPNCSTNESFRWRDIGTVGGQAGVPEPSSFLLLGSGLIGLAGMARRKFQS